MADGLHWKQEGHDLYRGNALVGSVYRLGRSGPDKWEWVLWDDLEVYGHASAEPDAMQALIDTVRQRPAAAPLSPGKDKP